MHLVNSENLLIKRPIFSCSISPRNKCGLFIFRSRYCSLSINLDISRMGLTSPSFPLKGTSRLSFASTTGLVPSMNTSLKGKKLSSRSLVVYLRNHVCFIFRVLLRCFSSDRFLLIRLPFGKFTDHKLVRLLVTYRRFYASLF